MIARLAVFLFGLGAYLLFLATVVHGIGFLGNVMVTKGIDAGPEGAVGVAAAVDLGLIALFGLQHSVMARPAFKRRWTRLIPVAAERSMYVLLSSLCLLLLFWQWRPIAGYVWNVEAGPLRLLLVGSYWLGWAIVGASSFLIDHFDLFGLRQAYRHLRGIPYEPVPFKMPAIYRHVRHPLMLGFLVAFWATPAMSIGHFLFALGMSAYIVIGTLLEERDLLASYGAAYARYRARVGMFFPVSWKRYRDE